VKGWRPNGSVCLSCGAGPPRGLGRGGGFRGYFVSGSDLVRFSRRCLLYVFGALSRASVCSRVIVGFFFALGHVRCVGCWVVGVDWVAGFWTRVGWPRWGVGVPLWLGS